MPEQPQSPRVLYATGHGGWRAVLDESRATPRNDAGQSLVTLRLEDGRQLLIPRDYLIKQSETTFFVPLALDDLLELDGTHPVARSEQVVIPILEEKLHVKKRTVKTGTVRVNKKVRRREEIVDHPLVREDVEIERVPCNRMLDKPVPAQFDGETMIIPLMEEVLVVEKRLVLREEIHIKRKRTTIQNPQKFTLRSEDAHVERIVHDEKTISAS